MNKDAVQVNKCSDSDLLSVLENFESEQEIKEHELFHCGHAAIIDVLCDVTKNGEEEPPLMYLKNKDGSPHLSYDVVLGKRSVKFTDRWDLESIILIGSGEFQPGFCSPDETAAIEIEAKRAAWQRDNSNSEKLEELCKHADTYPQRALEALFQLLEKDASEEVKDYFRGTDLGKETAYLNSELAKRVRQLAYPPFPPEMSDEKLAGIGYAWHLDDPEIARWRGADPIPSQKAAAWLLKDEDVKEFGEDGEVITVRTKLSDVAAWHLDDPEIYDSDVSGDPQKAAAWLLKDEDVKEFGEDGEVITIRTKLSDVAAWHLDDPEIARWRGADPIPAFGPVYDSDVSGDPQKAAAWLLKDEEVKEFGEDGEMITVRTKLSDVVIYLATLQREEPLEYARLAKKLAKILDISKKDFEAFLQDKIAIATESSSEILLEDLPRIKDEADKIIAADQGFNYCVQSWNRSHTGDLPVGKILFIQRGAQCCINTKGIHIHLTGSSAAGKSDAAKCYCEREPKNLVVNADISPRALYYAADLAGEGATVNVDDTVWTDELGNLFKKATTEFQNGAELLVVNDTKNGRKTVLEKIKPRTAFIMSSVRADAEDQVRDRTLAVPVLSSPERIEEIKGFMAGKFMKPQTRANTEDIAICRAIVKDMASHLWEVVIPFADRVVIRGETRAMAIFLDIICSCACWHYTKRQQIEAGPGFRGFNLVATEADFYEAKEIYEAVQGHSREKLTEKELLILKTIKEQGLLSSKNNQPIRVIQRGVLQKLTGISAPALSNYIHGRKHKGGGERGSGLLDKVPEMQFSNNKENIRMVLEGGSEIYSESREFIYWLPDDYQVVDYISVGAKGLVFLKSEV
jgi:hypothetical protein